MNQQIRGAEGITEEQLSWELQRGGRLVVFHYCVSGIVLTFRQPSAIYLIRQGESAIWKGLPYTLLSLVTGWWGFPWGPIYTVSSLITNFGGGEPIALQSGQGV